MVFPISDDNSDRRINPIVNYVLIGLNVFVFLVFQGMGTNEKFTYAFSAVPAEIVTGKDLVTQPHQAEVDPYTKTRVEVPGLQPMPLPLPGPLKAWVTLLTSIFMHGSIMHLLGNMLFLWIFGDNLEDVLGHARYLVFYLLCGLIASLSHVFATYAFHGDPMIPSLGASGAISGVMGGYLVLFPHRRVTVILLRMVTQVPAYVAVGMWFLFQVGSSLVGLTARGDGESGGVAYGAHIGGFIAGAALIKLFCMGMAPVTWPGPPRSRRPF